MKPVDGFVRGASVGGPGGGRDPVEVLAEEFLQRRREGSGVSVAEYARRYPQWSQRIHELFSTLVLIEDWKTPRPGSRDATVPDRVRREGAGERLGDFRIVREVARGGMGIVYEAEQESLGRRVALKVVWGLSTSSTRALRRFEREAQAAARLHHTNIVPVFGVGEQDGQHYYVMQFIEGRSLDSILERLGAQRDGPPQGDSPTAEEEPGPEWLSAAREAGDRYWAAVARIGVQAAEALQYAHDQGVLHRDVKPGNLMVDGHGTVWITDFGLAKLAEREDLTSPGDVVGTLRYMAPELLDGQSDARSDVYSLGLTLYELVTLQPAFDGASRHRLLRQVSDGAPPRPRRLDRRIPRDLETIVLKAIARRPADRYATAGRMAEDLRLFLEDRPVTARRTTPVGRLWRWCRRNPAVATLSSTVVALLAAVAIVTSVGYVRTREAAIQVSRALDGETRQRERAEATSELALEVLDRIYTQFAPDRVVGDSEPALEDSEGQPIEVPYQPVLSKQTAALLENLLAFYDRLAEQGGDDTRLGQRVADANRRVGDIQSRLGDYDQARTAYERSVAAYQDLAEGSDEEAKFAVEIARIYNDLGRIDRATRQPDHGRAWHEKALENLEAAGDRADRARYEFELARTHLFLGLRYGPFSRDPGPGPAEGFRNKVRPFPPRGPRFPGPGRGNHAFDSQAREDHLDRAVTLLEGLLAERPAAPEYRHLLAQCYRETAKGALLRAGGDAPDALSRATELLEALVKDFPDVADYRYDLSEMYAAVDLRPFTLDAARTAAAEARLRQAATISDELVWQHPNVPDYAASQVRLHDKLAGLLRRTKRADEAQASLRKALAVQSSLVDEFPEVTHYKLWQSRLQYSLAELLRDGGKLAEARSLLETSVATLQELAADEQSAHFVGRVLAGHSMVLADVLRRMGEDEAASAIRRDARGQHWRSRPTPPGPFGPRGSALLR